MYIHPEISRLLKIHAGLVLILAAFLALGITYSIITPIFEAGDELWHYPVVQYLATGHGLPVQDPNVKTLWEQEGGQPPLYYALSALATFWIDTRDLPERLWRNPEAKIGIPLVFGNKNMIVHTSAENFPWQNTTLAVHLIRFISLILSACTVALTYFLTLEILTCQESHAHATHDKILAVITAALVAFNPMFIFISASVNNDNLATMLATLALLRMTQLVTRGATLKRFVILGVVLGLGALTKITNLGLLVVAACVFAYLLWRNYKQGDKETRKRGAKTITISPLRKIVTGSLISAAIVVAIAFWWYVRNWILYGDLLAFNVWVQIAGGRPTPMTLALLFSEIEGFLISFWGNFGGVNLIAPGWVYLVLNIATLFAVLGLAVGLVLRTLPRLLALPALWLAIILLSLVRWTWITMASQGRLIFPAISAVAILLTFGLRQLAIRNSQFTILRLAFYVLRFANLSLVIFLFTFSVLAPFTIIAPAYALPARFADDSKVPNPVQITFDHQAELVGYALPEKTVAPGAELPLTVYWRARERIGEDLSVYIRLFDSSGRIIARWDAFPGGGMYPTRVWQPGEIIEDRYRIRVVGDARLGVGRIEVGLFRRVPLENLTARDPRGNVITPTIAQFKVSNKSLAQIPKSSSSYYIFGETIALRDFDKRFPRLSPGASFQVKLDWQALAPIAENYSVFVHLVDANGKIVAQKDDQPQQGTYPTSFWDVGETVADDYSLDIPRDILPGEYKIEIGIYRISDGARLPVNNGDHVILTTVDVGQ